MLITNQVLDYSVLAYKYDDAYFQHFQEDILASVELLKVLPSDNPVKQPVTDIIGKSDNLGKQPVAAITTETSSGNIDETAAKLVTAATNSGCAGMTGKRSLSQTLHDKGIEHVILGAK